MRSGTTYPQKTNITSLAATAGLMAFVIWMTSFANHHGSLYAPAPHSLPAANAGLAAIHRGADVGRAADRGSPRGQG